MTLTSTRELELNVVTPTIRKASRKFLYWVIAVVAIGVVALISILFNGAAQPTDASLSATDPGPKGGKALAEVLRQQGVSVTATDTMRATRAAASDPANTTIFLVDLNGYLSAHALSELTKLSAHLIIVSPTFDQLDALAPEVALAGNVQGTLKADCSLRPVQQAKSISGDGIGFRVIDSGADTIECFDSGDNIHSLIQVTNQNNRITVVGFPGAFSNEFVQFHGNAALALGLLGEKPNLVWLVPSITEASATEGATIAELTPLWVTSIMTLFIISAVVAGYWRGRRFGPLVVEALPVVVRASETMHGRARLYQKASDYLHTLDALRMGTIDRLSVVCGLPSSATVNEVILAVTSATNRGTTEIANLLRDAQPNTEAQLIQFSDELMKLEAATIDATRPSSTKTGTITPTAEPGA